VQFQLFENSQVQIKREKPYNINLKNFAWRKCRKIFLEAIFSHLRKLFSKFPHKVYKVWGASKKLLKHFPMGSKFFNKPLMAKKCLLCPINIQSIKVFMEGEGVETNMVVQLNQDSWLKKSFGLKKNVGVATESVEHIISLILRKECLEGTCLCTLYVDIRAFFFRVFLTTIVKNPQMLSLD